MLAPRGHPVHCCVSCWGSSHYRVWGSPVPSCFATSVPPNLVLIFLLLAHSPLLMRIDKGAPCRALPPVVVVGWSHCDLGCTRDPALLHMSPNLQTYLVGAFRSILSLEHGTGTTHPMVSRRLLSSPGARLLAALHPIAPFYTCPVPSTTAMPLPAVRYSKNGAVRLLSHPIRALLSWWPWATLPPAPCTMGFFVRSCPLCTHRCVLLSTVQRSQFLATLCTTAVPSPASFAAYLQTTSLSSFVCSGWWQAVYAPSGPALSLQGPTQRTTLAVLPTCGLLVHLPNLACPPPRAPATPPS